MGYKDSLSYEEKIQQIVCKNCGRYDERTGYCYRFTQYDRGLDKGNENQFTPDRRRDPDDRCSYFMLDVFAGFMTEYSVSFEDVPGFREKLRAEEQARRGSTSSGCYVATCVYGSYDCPQVWTLRRFRDEYLAKSAPGRAFIHAYYAVSPKVVKAVGDTVTFRKFFRLVLDRFVIKLNRKGYENTPYNDK